MALRPFERLPYDALPALPRIPHGYHRAEARTVRVPSRIFGDVRVHVRVTGSGPPLLLVHGLMTSSYSFRYVLEPLGRHFRVYAPDMPGSGRSDKPTGADFSARSFGAFLAELQEALGIRGCVIAGNSLGGYVAMHLALQDPAAASRLVVNHAPGTPDPRYFALRALLSTGAGRALLRHLVQRDPRRWVYRNVHYHDERLKSREELDEYGAPLATDDGITCFTKSLHETLAPAGFRAFVDALGRAPFPVPLLFVYARKDPVVPPRVGEALHRLARGSELRYLDGTSHFSHVDSPDRLVDTILPFLRAGEPGEAARAPLGG
ncbi:alpha/beta fold hydrolase [Polyangium spumosum]|uniref:Alpha/beta fold hydrolase n=1 Tax=Polyangium spumosum TaxID=889282 RepID=A0A6N7PED4_9BACT|nr:alpha/beta hydrolase [Polyangium spumosum]MRG90422.1 alpha/beta fold hydrolase [Polyangium spumosum]